MPNIHFDLAKFVVGGVVNVAGHVTFEPTRKIIKGNQVILPKPFAVKFDDTDFTVPIEPNGAGWAWRITVTATSIALLDGFYTVPKTEQTLEYVKLTEVDPITLEVGEPKDPAWWSQLNALIAMGGVPGKPGKDGLPGRQGNQGEPGPPGKDGAQGPRGKMVYPRVSYVHGELESVKYTEITVHDALMSPGSIKKTLAGDSQTATVTNYETARQVSNRLGYGVVVNGSGFDPVSGLLNGAQVLNGVALQDFDPSYSIHAVGVRQDGTMKIYTWPDHDVNAMVADGVENSFSFRQAYIINGVINPDITTSPQVSARLVMGWRGADLKLLMVEGATDISGVTQMQMQKLSSDLKYHNAIALGGGGDTQAVINGNHLVGSSDPVGRSVADFICIPVPYDGNVSTRWVEPVLTNGFVQHTAKLEWRLKNNQLDMRGGITNPTQEGGNVQACRLPWYARPVAHTRISSAMGTIPSYLDMSTAGYLSRYVLSVTPNVTYCSPMTYSV